MERTYILHSFQGGFIYRNSEIMKIKTLIALILTFIVLLITTVSCRSNDQSQNDNNETTTETSNETTPATTSIFDLVPTHEGRVEWEYDLDDYILQMSNVELLPNGIGGIGGLLRLYNKSTGNMIMIIDHLSGITMPTVSPNRTQFVYFDSFGEMNYVNIYDINTHEKLTIDVVPIFYDVTPEERWSAHGTPRTIRWLDDDTLLVRMTNMHGSVRGFSEVLYFNIESGDFDRIFLPDRYTDFIWDMEWNEDVLEITVIRQCDNINLIEDERVFEFERSRVLDLMNGGETIVLSW